LTLQLCVCVSYCHVLPVRQAGRVASGWASVCVPTRCYTSNVHIAGHECAMTAVQSAKAINCQFATMLVQLQ
jgi:hypothetical protein